MLSNRVNWETLRRFDSSTLTTSYQTFSTPLANPSYICKVVNNSTSTVVISIDGVNDIDVCPPNSFWLYDESKVGSAGGFPAIPQGTQFYLKLETGSSAGTSGTYIYLVTQYIIQG